MGDPTVQSLIEKYALIWGVPVALATAQQQEENAPQDPNAVSPEGAIGLFQLEPKTALWLVGMSGMIQKALTIPEFNVMLAIFYDLWLRAQLEGKFTGTDLWKAVLAAYNCGLGNVQKAIEAAQAKGSDATVYQNIVDFLPTETQNYVARIWTEFQQMTNPEA
jgi:soluble lytic murein transglycosylase-like protein